MSIHAPEETQNSEIRMRPPEKDDIVISGISCRLPESDNMEEFRHHLLHGEDMVTETDRRWEPGYSSLPTHTGTIRDLTRFDTSYFGIPPKVAEVMDPQLRIMLELTQEALVDGGLLAQDLRGSRTGVFIGCGFSEAYEGFSTDPEHVKGYAPLGGTASMFANRISYSFDLKGPSYALRNGDGSSLLAVDRAVMSIRAGNCDSAIVGGCNLCLKPAASLQALDMNILSPDGRCRCYDENANGVCRSEGVVILLLQKRHAAKRVYARILHSKAMTFHESLYPPYLSHKTFLQEVYHEVGISPSDVGYVETSSSCTTDGDSEELRVLADVMCKGRKSPLLIGSVKSNIGHTETASGISSLAKAVVAFHDQMIPANLHYKTPNSRIPALNDGSLKVVTERTRMHNQVVAVSSFGLGGACVHVILDSGNQPKSKTSDCDTIQNERLLLYCGRTKEAVDYVLTHMQNNAGNLDLHYMLNETANCPTTNCPFRGYVILNSEDNVREIQKCTSDKRPIWYVFSGMGSQWPGMARRMMAIPKFRQTIQYCDNILHLHGVSLMDIIMKGDENTYDRVLHSFVAIASIQVALVDLLVAMGIQPDGIVGHSVGELGCGYADGSLTAEETVLAAYWRGRCIQESNLPPGGMAAVGCGYADGSLTAEETVLAAYWRGRCIQESNLPPGGMAAVGLTWAEAKKQCPGQVVPACHNSEKTVTISGPKEEVADFVRELKEKGVFAREVNSAGVAFHSPAMKEVAPAFLNELKKVIKPKKRSKRWISSSIPESRWSCDLAQHSSAEYHANNFQSPVLFQEAIQHIPDGAVVIEIAPHCLLQAVLKRSLGSNCSMIGLMKRGDPDNVRVFYSNLGKCYMNGVRLNPLGLITPYSFPVPRGTPMCSSLVKWDHSQTWPLSKLGDFISGGSGKQADSQFEVDVSPQSKDHYLVGHRIDGRVLYPACGYVVLAWKALANMTGQMYERMPVVFENIKIHRATVLPKTGSVKFDVSVMKATGEFEICESGALVASGVVHTPTEPLRTFYDETDNIQTPISPNRLSQIPLSMSDVYKEFRLRGYEYGPTFQGIMKAGNQGERAELEWTGQWISFLDTMLQVNLLTLPGRGLLLPVGVRQLTINPLAHINKILPLEGGKKGVVVLVDRYAAITVSGGVEMQGLEVKNAPAKVSGSAPVVEKSVFIPYIDQSIGSPELVDYAQCCSSLITELVRKLSNIKGIQNQQIFKDFLKKEKSSKSQVDQKKISSLSNSGLLSFAKRLTSSASSKNFLDIYSNMIAAYKTELLKDCLLTSYLHQESLKPCIDVVIENTDTNVLRVLEVEATESKLQKEVVKYLELQPSVHVEFTAADSQVTNQNPGLQELEKQGVEVRRWNLSEDPENTEAYDLIVANNVLHNQSNITKCLQNMSKALKNNGFLLFVEATRNHVIGLIFEGLANKIPEMEDRDSRTLSCYCDEKQWEKLLESTGYKVVAMKTDNCFNTTFLARKSQDIVISKQTILSVNGSHAEWLDKLKDKMLKMQEAPKGHNLWLVSDQREASGIVGLTNCLRKEPEGERIRCICNMESNKEKLRQTDLDKVMRKDLVMNVFTGKKWGSYRHLQIDEPGKVECEDAYLTCKVPGDSSSLTWVPNQSNHSSHKEEGKLPVKVFYTALNIEDKALIEMTATETLKLEHPGQEFSGIDEKGRQVMGLLAEGKALSPLIIADVHRLWEVPHHWNLREASTVSWCYSMAYYALILQGQVKENTRVLIHGGDSDIGVASINVAMHAGCKVLATVESWDRKSYLLDCCSKLKKKFIYVNEKGHVYHDMLRTTKEDGVDVVLNTYLDRPAGPEFDLLTAKGGKYLDMCRYNKNNVLEGDRLKSNTELYHINMDHLTPAIEEKLYTLVRDGIVKGEVQPIKSKIYQKNKVKEALRDIGPYMKGYSKVVIQLRDEHDVNKNDPVSIERIKIPVTPEVACHPEKVYILTGGLGGFGLELSDWLIQKGAKKLVLTSRSGITQGYQAKKRRLWNAEGVQVEIMTNNIKVETECKRLLENSMKMGPIGGIFNLAMVLMDGMLDSQTVDSFSKVLEPKVLGTLNLDKLSRSLCKDSLDWFVVFSSVTSGRGNIGQTNYGYANSFMERVCERRREEGLPGLAIQWGAIGDVGVVIDKMGGNDTVVGGTIPQRMASCLVTMEQLLLQTQPVVSSFVPASKETRRSTGEEGEKKSMLEAVLHVIGIKDADSLSPESTLGDLGMDSLMSVEIKMILDSQYKLTLTDTEVRKLTVKKMQEFSKKKESKKSERGSPKQETVAVNNTVSDGDASMLLLPRERIIRLNKGQENKDPIFFIHSLDASVQHWEPYVKRLDNPVYGIQAVPTVPTKYVEAVAGLYHQLIDSVAPDKKINLVGHSFGGIVALEMMLQSQIEKGRSGTLVMIDSSLDFLPDLSHDINQCDETTGQMDVIILKEFVNRLKLDSSLLGLNETASLDEKMSSVTRHVLESGKFTNAAHIQHAARKFHDRVVAYLEYATDDGVRGEIHLIRPENCPEKRCQETKNYHLDCFANKVTVHTIDSNHADVVNGTAMGSIVEHLKNIFSTDGN